MKYCTLDEVANIFTITVKPGRLTTIVHRPPGLIDQVWIAPAVVIEIHLSTLSTCLLYTLTTLEMHLILYNNLID